MAQGTITLARKDTAILPLALNHRWLLLNVSSQLNSVSKLNGWVEHVCIYQPSGVSIDNSIVASVQTEGIYLKYLVAEHWQFIHDNVSPFPATGGSTSYGWKITSFIDNLVLRWASTNTLTTSDLTFVRQ